MKYIFVTPQVYSDFRYAKKDNDALSVFGNIIQYNILRDRFGYLNKFSN